MSRNYRLSLILTKLKFMVFHTHYKNAKVPTINNTNIVTIEQFILLGLTLDLNLNWKKLSDSVTIKML